MESWPQRLHHNTPGWVEAGAMFHIRIRLAKDAGFRLADVSQAAALLAAARSYHDAGKWACHLFVLMPDHVHAMLSFPADTSMSVVVRNWKRGTARLHGVQWQENYFDHRIRNEAESVKTWIYLRRNPVVKGLCSNENAWPWWWSGTVQGADQNGAG